MTMTGHQDSEDASYLELAEFIATWGEVDHITRDLEELFTRLFSMLPLPTVTIICAITAS